MKEEILVFKAYLRESLEHQVKLEKAIKNKDFLKAEELVKQMIDRTQREIEEN